MTETTVKVKATDFHTFEGRAKNFYNIRNKEGIDVPYEFNEAQKILNRIIEEEFERSYKETGYYQCKIQVLKSRQVGITTDTALRNLDFMCRKSVYGLVLNHTGEDSDLAYDKYRIAYDGLPNYVQLTDENGNLVSDQAIPYKPKEYSYSAKQLRFADQTKSWVTIRTAGSGDNVGKGSTVQFVHFTESANYTHYGKVFSSVMQQVPKKSDHFVVNESTANGTTGSGEGFYKDWVNNETAWKRYKRGETESFEGFRPVFIPWYLMSEYTLPLRNGKFVDIDSIDFGSPEGKRKFLEKEQLLMDEHGVSKESINWYRANIKENCQYKLSEANRYYPTFPEDAFLASDKCFFDSSKLHTIKHKIESGAKTLDGNRGYLNESLEFVPSQTGELVIKEHPDSNFTNRYIISLDQSTGLEEGDYACMKVLDRVTRKHVARWKGKLAEDLLAQEFIKLGTYYNHAYGIPEANLATVVNIIKPDGLMPYDGELFAREYKASGEPLWGMFTSGGTRKILLDEHLAFVRDRYDDLFDLETVDEYISFVRNVTKTGNVRYEADNGKHDDEVMADCLCTYAYNRYDEDIGELNNTKTDYSSVIRVKGHKRKGMKNSALGASNTSYVKKIAKT